MAELKSRGIGSDYIKVPDVLFHENEFLAIEDANTALTLREFINSNVMDPSLYAYKFASNLAGIINELQMNNQFKLPNEITDHVPKLYLNIVYDKIAVLLRQANILNAEEVQERAVKIIKSAFRHQYGLIMGDLWPNNILFNESLQQFWLIDWELSVNAHPAIDCAHFIVWMVCLWRDKQESAYKTIALSFLENLDLSLVDDGKFWSIFWVHFGTDLLLEVRTGDWHEGNEERRLALIVEAAEYLEPSFSGIKSINFLFEKK